MICYKATAVNRDFSVVPDKDSVAVFEDINEAIFFANGISLRYYMQYAHNTSGIPNTHLIAHATVFEVECDKVKIPPYPEAPYKYANNVKYLALHIALCDFEKCQCRKKLAQLKENLPYVKIHATTVPRTNLTEKKCSICGEIKPLADFIRVWDNSDGKGYTCKSCREQNRNKIKEPVNKNNSTEIEGDRYYCSDVDDPILPSDVSFPSEVHWLQYLKPESDMAHMSGKWLIYASPDVMDKLWPTLKRAVYDGKLGDTIKASKTYGIDDGVICVYGKNFLDFSDTHRILVSLREIGINQPISYKTDEQTLESERGSIWYSPNNTLDMFTTKIGRRWMQEHYPKEFERYITQKNPKRKGKC